MKVYAVIDTNVIVSAMLTRKALSATTQVFEAFQSGDIVLLYNEEIGRTRIFPWHTPLTIHSHT